jgi:hypothetical protein
VVLVLVQVVQGSAGFLASQARFADGHCFLRNCYPFFLLIKKGDGAGKVFLIWF